MVASVFGAAPRALAGVINLQQTVDLVRLSIDVVEANIDELLDPADVPDVHAAVLHYAREVAFATAAVYARAAEVRGAWDARLEALVVDAVLRSEADETLLSRASALGWTGRGEVAVVLGAVPGDRRESDTFDEVRRVARTASMDALCAVQGERLVVVLGGVTEPRAAAEVVSDLFGDGPVVVGPVASDLAQAYGSARAALSAHRAAVGWPEAPRPVRSSDLLPERALAGDGHARRQLVEEVYLPLAQARGTLIETIAAYFQHGSSIEATGRALFVHANTVRYRLRQVAELTGFSPTDARDAFTLEIALVLGRQSGRSI
jgi:sugar diacid utilization regulator